VNPAEAGFTRSLRDRGSHQHSGGDVQLESEQWVQARELILGGLSDEQIAEAMLVSVKQVRLVRAEVEAEVRPR